MLLFEELLLKDFGNRIPNITAEVLESVGSDSTVVTNVYGPWSTAPSRRRSG